MSADRERTIREAAEELRAIARDLDREPGHGEDLYAFQQRTADRLRNLADRLTQTAQAPG